MDYQDGYVDQFILAHAVRLDIGRTGLPEAEAVQGAGDGDGVVPGGGVGVDDGGGGLGPRSRGAWSRGRREGCSRLFARASGGVFPAGAMHQCQCQCECKV